MKAFVVRCEYENGDSFEWPRFVVLGKRADVLAMENAAQALSGRVDIALAEAFILTLHAGTDILMREIHQGLERLREWVGDDGKAIVATFVPTDDNRFAISLIAAAPFV